jgi:hypothetical protein
VVALSTFPVVACCAIGPSQERSPGDPVVPELLQSARRAREQLQTARIEYPIRDKVETDSLPPHADFFTFRWADDRYMVVNRGDEEGVVMRNELGEPATYTYAGPIHALLKDGQVGQHTENSPRTDVWGAEHAALFGLQDLRQLGLTPGLWKPGFEQEVERLGASLIEYAQRQDGDLYIVTGKSGLDSVSWWVDSRKDFSVVPRRRIAKMSC